MVTVCNQCKQDFQITEELIGSKVECPVCCNKWVVQDLSIIYPPLYDLPDYTVIDLETTGLSPREDRIIEVAAKKVRKHQVVDSIETFVYPGCSVPQAVTSITGIRTSMLKDAPLWHEIADNLSSFIDGERLIGHNIIDFDSLFLHNNFSRVMKALPKWELLDTLDMARELFPQLENHKLSTITSAFNIKTPNHRAMADVECTRQIFEGFLKITNEYKIDLYNFMRYPVMKPYKTTFDDTNPFYKKNIVLTGEFDQLVREDAIAIIENMGGHYQTSVSMKTDFLVLCNGESDGTKHKKAKELQAKGMNITIINGSYFIQIYRKQNKGKLSLPPLSRHRATS